MEIQHVDDGKKGKFFILVDGAMASEMTYVWAGEEKFIIDHTEVGEALKGQGAGRKLVHAAVEFARDKHLKILPLCPFAKAVFQKTAEYSDVLA